MILQKRIYTERVLVYMYDNSSIKDFMKAKGLRDAGIQVVVRDEVQEHFALIDENLVWHGGMNLLGKEDAWDNLMRIKSAKVAEELLEIVLINNNE